MHFLQANFFWYKKESSSNVTPHTHAYAMHKQRVSYAWLQAWKYIHNLPEKRQATSENMIRNMKIPTHFPFKRIPKMLDDFKAHCKEPRYSLSLSLFKIKTHDLLPMTYDLCPPRCLDTTPAALALGRCGRRPKLPSKSCWHLAFHTQGFS